MNRQGAPSSVLLICTGIALSVLARYGQSTRPTVYKSDKLSAVDINATYHTVATGCNQDVNNGWVGGHLVGVEEEKCDKYFARSCNDVESEIRRAQVPFCTLLRWQYEQWLKWKKMDPNKALKQCEDQLQWRMKYLKGKFSEIAAKKTGNQAVFITGGVAVGKSRFISQHMAALESNAVHVNADELRGKLAGEYKFYAALYNNGKWPEGLDIYADRLRNAIQEEVLNIGASYLADSNSIPADIPLQFAKKGYEVKVYYLEAGCGASVPSCTWADKERIAELRVDERVCKGEHKAPVGGISTMHAMYMKTKQALQNSQIPVEFYISQQFQFQKQ